MLLHHSISLIGSAHGGEIVKEYIQQFFRLGTEPNKYGKINIKYVCDMPLGTLIFNITKLAGSVTLHVANRSYIQYALECLYPTVFN